MTLTPKAKKRKRIDWKNVGAGVILGAIVAIIISVVCYIKSENRSEDSSARSISHQDSIADTQARRMAATQSQLDSLMAQAHEQTQSLGRIEESLKNRFIDIMADLTKKYPNGWAAFYASYDRPVVYPFKVLDSNDYISIDLIGAELERMGPDRYRLKLPDILDKKHFFNYHDNTYYFNGSSRHPQSVIKLENMRMFVEPLESDDRGLICVIGIRVYKDSKLKG